MTKTFTYLISAHLIYLHIKQGRKRPLDTPERKIERRERETVMTETQRNMIEREREVKGRGILRVKG